MKAQLTQHFIVLQDQYTTQKGPKVIFSSSPQLSVPFVANGPEPGPAIPEGSWGSGFYVREASFVSYLNC